MCIRAMLGLSAGCLDQKPSQLQVWGLSAAWQNGLAGGDILCINKPLSYLQELFSYGAKTLLNYWILKLHSGVASGCCS